MVEKSSYFKSFGKLFQTYEAAVQYDNDMKIVLNLIKDLYHDPYEIPGGKYVNIDFKSYKKVNEEFWKLCKEHKHTEKIYNDYVNVQMGIGRILDDSDSVLSKLFYHLSCCKYFSDNDIRMYNQPYYALHPDEANKRFKQ